MGRMILDLSADTSNGLPQTFIHHNRANAAALFQPRRPAR